MTNFRRLPPLLIITVIVLSLVFPWAAIAGESEWGGPETKDSSVTRGQRDTQTGDYGTLERGRDIARGKDTAAKPSTGVKLTGDEFGSRPDTDEADLSGPDADYHGGYSGGITQDGIQGNSSLGGSATLVSGRTGKLGGENINANFSGLAGASGEGEANVEVSTRRIATELEGNVVLGLEGKGSGTICITLCGAKLEGTVEGTVYAGAAARGRVILHISWKKIKIGAKLAGALGLGAGLGTDITLDFSNWTDTVVGWFSAPPSDDLPWVPKLGPFNPILDERFLNDPLSPFLPRVPDGNSNSQGSNNTFINILNPQPLTGDGWSQTPKLPSPSPYVGGMLSGGWNNTSKMERAIEKLVQGKDVVFDASSGRTSYIDRSNGHRIEIDSSPFNTDGAVIVVERNEFGQVIARAAIDAMGQIRQLPLLGQIVAPQKAAQKKQKQEEDEEAFDGFEHFDAIQSGQPLFHDSTFTPAGVLDSTPETRSIQEDAQSPKSDSGPHSPDC